MKKVKKPIYLRYEFSNEKGKLEGGDIFEYPSLAETEAMISQILAVAHSDGVAVNITVGESTPFHGFLKNVGLTEKDLDAERVPLEAVTGPASPKKSGKKARKKK